MTKLEEAKVHRLIDEMDKWVIYFRNSRQNTERLQEIARQVKLVEGVERKMLQNEARNISIPPRVFNTEDAIKAYMEAKKTLVCLSNKDISND